MSSGGRGKGGADVVVEAACLIGRGGVGGGGTQGKDRKLFGGV